MTHWSTRALARVAVERGLRPQIAHSTVSLILRYAELQPHRSRYWQTPTLNEAFRRRAAGVLWCYENVHQLAEKGELVLCLDEKPNIQALERTHPTRPLWPGRIERQEWEYIRHGTVNFLVALVVSTGRMRGWCLAANKSANLRPALRELFREHRRAKRIHLIWDGGPSHTALATQIFLRQHYPQVRVLQTPAHASWLDQAELLLRAFSDRYLNCGDWASREELVQHLEASSQEYNQLWAHPFRWTWTRSHLREWMKRHTGS